MAPSFNIIVTGIALVRKLLLNFANVLSFHETKWASCLRSMNAFLEELTRVQPKVSMTSRHWATATAAISPQALELFSMLYILFSDIMKKRMP
jgi:hypothetical protein